MKDSHEASPVDIKAVHTERPSMLCAAIHPTVSITGIVWTSLISTLESVHDYKVIINQAVIRIEASYESIVDALKNLARSQPRSTFTLEGSMNTVKTSVRYGFMAMVLLTAATLAGCMGWAPGRQAYWDAQVKEMCAKDGGVKIFEQIVVTPSQTNVLPRIGDLFGVASEALAKPEEPAFIRIRETLLREYNPSVVRYEQEIVRRADQRVVGVAVSYARGGGDLPLGGHPSTFWCPELKQIYEGIHKVYRVEEMIK
jgi:hypothetical protein